ncbi:MAG TPA: hypothetical protein VK155_10355 [Bacteroidales bacterium]|jgi:hypothetical protein|nr:hypothetical protein [Bacteroidales bacterium]
MASTIETGHEKNVANFDAVISSAQGIGKDYNPPKGLLSYESLQNISASNKNELKAVRSAFSDYKTAVSNNVETASSDRPEGPG